jgi:two-component system phosphate regulon response regulator PhoB
MVLLDWNLPGQSGLSLVRRLRAQSRTRGLPIMMVTARCGEPTRSWRWKAGADDYMTKPFSPREMVARVHCLLRRWQPQSPADAPVQLAGLRLDPCTQRVTAGARELALGRVEFKLLNFLMSHPERVHTRAQLLDQVWGSGSYLDERTVDTHVGRLRSAAAERLPAAHRNRARQRLPLRRGAGVSMEQLVILSKLEQEYLLHAIEAALPVQDARQFFLWTQGQLQSCCRTR